MIVVPVNTNNCAPPNWIQRKKNYIKLDLETCLRFDARMCEWSIFCVAFMRYFFLIWCHSFGPNWSWKANGKNAIAFGTQNTNMLVTDQMPCTSQARWQLFFFFLRSLFLLYMTYKFSDTSYCVLMRRFEWNDHRTLFQGTQIEKKKKSNCEMVYGQSMSTYKKRVNSSNGDLKKILLYVVIYAVVCPLSDRFKLKTSLIISYVKSCVLSCTSIFTFHTYMRVWPVPAVRLYASPSRYTVCTYSVVHMTIYAAPEMCMSWLDKKEKKN